MCPCSVPVSRQECSSTGSGGRIGSCHGPAAAMATTTDSDLQQQLEVVVIQLEPELDQNTKHSSSSSRRLPSKMLVIHVALAVSQFGYAANQILARTALVGGINQFVYSIYRNLVGFGLLAPTAYLLERSDSRRNCTVLPSTQSICKLNSQLH